MLKMIAGLKRTAERLSEANHCVIRYLPQNPKFAEQETVLEAVLRGNRRAENEAYVEAEAKNTARETWVADFAQPCGQLSGGQRKRLALVSVLLSPAEILVLDEPTNHLDNEMSNWLEEVLKEKGRCNHGNP